MADHTTIERGGNPAPPVPSIVELDQTLERGHLPSAGSVTYPLSLRAEGRIPILFSQHYDFRLEDTVSSIHPFYFRKRSDAFSRIKRGLGFEDCEIFEPRAATYEELRLVHEASYLERLTDPQLVSRVMNLPDLGRLTSKEIADKVLAPILLATGGTILGVELALKHGWAVNLSGGFHHASREKAEGFCFIADTPVAFKCFHEKRPGTKVLFCDLDAHFMNGPCAELGKEKEAILFDIHNRDLSYPNDPAARALAHYCFPVPGTISDGDYLGLLGEMLPRALSEHSPGLLIYHAGCDVYRGDRLGRMTLSREAVIERDCFVFRTAFERGIPILMVLAGGYSQDSAELIASSVVTMAKRYLGA